MLDNSARPFVGRSRELAALRTELDGGRPSLVLIEGRRRAGKTALALQATRQAARPERTVYFTGARVTDSANLARFREAAAPALGDPPSGSRTAEDWPEILTRLARRAAGAEPRLAVVLDEFPYLWESNRELPSAIAEAWEGIRTRGDPLKLILIGSNLPSMTELSGSDSPLGPFVESRVRVGPLPIRSAAQLLSGWSSEARVYAFAVFGGMPHYLSMVDPARSLSENLARLVLDPRGPLFEEPEHLLQAEVTSLSRYATILGAVAAGGHNTRAIVRRVREVRSGADLTYYIEQLHALGFLEVVQPLGRSGERSPRRYEVADPFLAFWFRFVLPHRSALVAGRAPDVLRSRIVPALDAHTAPVFRRLCREWVGEHAEEMLGAPVREVGRLWGRDFELELVATLADGSVAYGACRWDPAPAEPDTLAELKEGAARAGIGDGAEARYLLFSGSGFTGELWQAAGAAKNVHLVPLERLLAS